MVSTTIFQYVAVPLLLLFVSTCYVVTSLSVNGTCIDEERVALLKFRKDLQDPTNCLSSWIGKDCCHWMGVECDNQTGHVLKLNLNSGDICSTISTVGSQLGGELNPSLAYLKYLTHLDLSQNDFRGIPIPAFIGSLSMLRHLDLVDANFSGMIPPHLGNLSNLNYLDISILSFSQTAWVRDLSWLSGLSSLQYLYMDDVNVTNTSHEWFRAVNMIPSLLELRLSGCNLRTLPLSLSFSNITSLSVFDLGFNNFSSSIPSSLFNNMSTLKTLDLSVSCLRGPLPKLGRGNLCKIQDLDLSGNENLTGDITEMLEALSSCSNQSLQQLNLGRNKLTGKLVHSLGQFNNLYNLDLSSNSLSGPIPSSIGNLSNLKYLVLHDNMMNGTIPESIGQLTQLSSLDLLDNSWEGTMTDTHFQNLTSLGLFSVSSRDNSLALKVSNDWVSPFTTLYEVEILDCQVGPTFPSWLRNQTLLEQITLRNAGISTEIPHWLFNFSSQLWSLDLSFNKISGYLPKTLNFSLSDFNMNSNQLKGPIPLWSGVNALSLRNNLLFGTIPANIGEEMSHLEILDLSNNQLNGSIPLSINWIQNLTDLDISNNYLIGEIPIFWMGMQSLRIIDLSNNSFSGGIPSSICSLLPSLGILDLRSNNLSGDLSSTFQNGTMLQTLILGNNRFFGSIPKGITKNLPSIKELQLRGNTLTGSIPKDICQLPFLHLLDLAENSLSGTIPACLGDVRGFKLPPTYFVDLIYSLPFAFSFALYTKHMELVLKGKTFEYLNQMPMQSTIDLSNNNLSGEIPPKLTELFHLGALNLSWNQFIGNIPNNIGSLTDLESLDLSHNHLSGPIPPTIVSLTFLSSLDLSYNNLSGQIPVANQFGTFTDPSIYEGNPGLETIAN